MALTSFTKHLKKLQAAKLNASKKEDPTRICQLSPGTFAPAKDWQAEQSDIRERVLDRFDDYIKNFLVPKPHGIDACEIDLRVWGKFNTTMNVEGRDMENERVDLEIIDGGRLVLTDTCCEGWQPAADPFLTDIIAIADDGNGGITYRQRPATDHLRRARTARI
ncbi:MAG: hypothetical protein AAFP85_10145 [Pseudomonadota bacterium]